MLAQKLDDVLDQARGDVVSGGFAELPRYASLFGAVLARLGPLQSLVFQ